MERFRDQRIFRRTSLATLRPLNLGKALRPLNRRENLLEEMLRRAKSRPFKRHI